MVDVGVGSELTRESDQGLDYWYRIRLNRHSTELRGRTHSLPHNRALKHDEHEQCKEAGVPVFFETPHHDTEDLENKEGCSGMFYE